MPFYMNSFGINRVPSVGLGTYAFQQNNNSESDENHQDLKNTRSAEEIVYYSIGHAGYRHIDTAHAYNNEKEVGRGIKRAMKDFGILR